MIEAHKKSEYGQDYKLAHNEFSTMVYRQIELFFETFK